MFRSRKACFLTGSQLIDVKNILSGPTDRTVRSITFYFKCFLFNNLISCRRYNWSHSDFDRLLGHSIPDIKLELTSKFLYEQNFVFFTNEPRRFLSEAWTGGALYSDETFYHFNWTMGRTSTWNTTTYIQLMSHVRWTRKLWFSWTFYKSSHFFDFSAKLVNAKDFFMRYGLQSFLKRLIYLNSSDTYDFP